MALLTAGSTAAVWLLLMGDQAPPAVRSVTLQPTHHRHCVCMAHGPRHGCLRWRCRRQYERA